MTVATLVDAASGILLAGAATWAAYAIASTLKARASSVRLTAAAVILLWLLTVAFLVLSPLHLFVRVVVVLLALAGAALAQILTRRADPSARAREDLRALRTWWSTLGMPLRILVAIGTASVAARLAHGLLAPCLTVDALTYHLVKAAQWGQAGGLVSTPGPDAAGYYNWFPPYGDALWTWALVALRSDVGNIPISVATWLLTGLATYGCTRALGATSARATAAAAAIAFTPSVLNISGAVYVDNLVAAVWLAAALFLTRACIDGSSEDAVVAAAALAVLGGVKSSTLPPALLGLALAVATARSRRSAALILLVASPVVVPSLLAWRGTGNPLYPLTLRLGSRVLLQGNAELEWLLRGDWLSPEYVVRARSNLVNLLFFDGLEPRADFLNFGVGPLLLLVPLVPGTLALWRRRPRSHRILAAYFAISLLLTVAAVGGSANLALRLYWGWILARLLTLALAAAVLLAAAWPTRLATICLFGCAAMGLLTAWPHGLSRVDVEAATAFLPPLGVAVILLIVFRHLRRGRSWATVAVLIAALSSLLAVRQQYRYAYFDAAARGHAYDAHPLHLPSMSSWPIWQRLDDDAAHTIAVSTGFDGVGHNSYRYPLMGARLQNKLVYVPISLNGEILDYWRLPTSAISCDAWIARLARSGADHLVLLAPPPPETAWTTRLPDAFVPEQVAAMSILYRIDSQALQAHADRGCTGP